jgi:hypothetical protein
MKGGWRTGTAWAAAMAGLLLSAPAALLASDHSPLSPYADSLVPAPPAHVDPILGAMKEIVDRESAPTIGTGFQVSLLLAWTHFGYGSQLKPRGFGAGLRVDIGWSDKVSLFLEARGVRGVADGTRASGDRVDVVFDAATGILGFSFLLPGSNLAHSDESISDAPFFHQIEFGAVGQRFEVDEDVWDSGGAPISDNKFDESGKGATLRYRVGSRIGERWYFSFTGGFEAILRKQIPEAADDDRWDVDVTFTLVVGVDF